MADHNSNHNSLNKNTEPPSNLPSLILNWNTRGILNKPNELSLLINQHNPISITLQETYSATKQELERRYKQYSWHTNNSSDNKYHHICTGIKKDFPQHRFPLNTNFPAIATKISSPISVTIVNIYIPCTYTTKNLEEELSNLICQLPPPLIIIGDFNANHYDPNSKAINYRGKIIHKLANNAQMKPLNDGKSTRICTKTGRSSTIDLCFASNNIHNNIKMCIDNDLHGSDHLPISIHMTEWTNQQHPRPRYIYEKADWPTYQQHISRLIRSNDGDHNVDSISSIITKAADMCIPKTSENGKRKNLPWLNDEVKTALKARRKALRALIRARKSGVFPIEPIAKEFQLAHHTSRIKIEQAKETYWHNFITTIDSNTSTTEMWKRVAGLKGKSHRYQIILQENDKTISDSQEIAQTFAKHFQSVSATDQYSQNFLKHKNNAEKEPINFSLDTNKTYNKPISIDELQQALRKCTGKSAGLDGIGYPLLQQLPPTGKNTLLNIFNEIWSTGNLPDCWKTSLIVPIPKQRSSKEKHNVRNYRPISLLSCMSKVLEKIVNRRLVQELEKNNLLSACHYAYRNGKGTEPYFCDLEQTISKAREKQHHTDCAVLDLCKAFDRSWRHAIVKQLSEWGFCGNITNFISNFLTTRTFRVLIGQTTSDLFIQENGVPQGAILSPTLFIISLQSLLQSIPSDIKTFIYADDIVLISSKKTPKATRNSLQTAMQKVQQWNRWTGYDISPDKCKTIHICKIKHAKRPDLTYNNTPIPQVKTAKILGVTIDSNLTFLAHCKELKLSTKVHLNILRMLASGNTRAPRQTLATIMNNWLLPKMLYGAEIYRLGGCKAINRIETIYNNAVRIISGAFRTSPNKAIICEMGLKPLPYILLQKLINSTTGLLEKNANPTKLTKSMNLKFKELTQHKIPRIARIPRLSSRPWDKPAPHIDWELKNKIKKGTTNNTIITQNFNALVNLKYKNHNHIYTDGSVLTTKAGCGIYSLNHNCAIKLPDHTSIFSAEAIALTIATDEGSSSDRPNVIFTDSASVLQALEKGASKNPFIQQLEIRAKDNITYCWIPGHADISGNIIADRLANEGRSLNTTCNAPLSRKDAKKRCADIIAKHWQKAWLADNTLGLRHIKLSTLPWTDTKNSKDQRVLTRLRIGHTKYTHSYIFDKGSPPLCHFCGTTITVRHILTECFGYTTERQNHDLSSNITEILNNNKDNEQKLLSFLKKAGLYSLF